MERLRLLILAIVLFISIYVLSVFQHQQSSVNVRPPPFSRYKLKYTCNNTVGRTFVPTDDPLISPADWEALVRELQWPSSPDPLPSSPQDATDASRCSFSLAGAGGNHTVGGYVDVTVVARDARGREKSYGGDFFQAKVYNAQLKASTYAAMTDYCNGTYGARVPLLWAGEARVALRLVHSAEAVRVLIRQREQDPDKVYFNGYFREGGREEVSRCNAQRSARLVGDGSGCCCEYREPVTGEQWYCRRPATLPCQALSHHSMGGYQAVLSALEKDLLRSSSSVIIPGDDSVVHVQQQGPPIRSHAKCQPGLETPVPAGFYLQDRWTSLVCAARAFPGAEQVSACLRDKQVLMMGDSTLRQWFEHLTKIVPTLKSLDLHTSDKSGPLEAVDTQTNTRVIWRAHGLPLRTSKTPWADLHYIARELDGLAGGEHSVFVFTIWAHFTTYPLALYAHRLMVIRRAVAALLQRAPRTLVVIKSANTGYKDVYGSDWLSWQLDRALAAVFRELPVVLVDVWQMTSCHYAPDNIHPPPVVVQNEVDLLLSFVCPQ